MNLKKITRFLYFKAMNQPNHVTKFLLNFVQVKFFILQNIFLKTWEIQQKTIKNVCKLCLSESSANIFTVNCSCK